jgi:hypothetical protein
MGGLIEYYNAMINYFTYLSLALDRMLLACSNFSGKYTFSDFSLPTLRLSPKEEAF